MRPVDPRRSRVVLVGTPFYDDDRLHDVPQVSNNIAGLFNLFTDPDRGGFEAGECKVAPPDAGIDQIGALLLAATTEADDLLLFYFSGHGVIGRRHRGLHLGVKRTDRDNVDFSGLDYERVRDACLSARAANRIVILDCCYSGQATGGTLGGLADEVLADIAIDGTVVLASAPANRAALVVDGEPHTAYTGRMLQVLRKGIPGKGEFLSALDIHEALYRVMRAQGLPEPQQRSTGMIHELGVVRNGSFGEEPEPAVLALPVGSGSEAPPAVSVLLSYAEVDHGVAEEIGASLRRQGIDARLHNTFLLDDPTIVNTGLARVVVPLVSTAYLDREETEGDLSAALVNPGTSLLPVIVGADPAPVTQRGAHIWERLELRRHVRVTPADPGHDALVAAVRSTAARAAAGGPAARIVPLPDEVTIWYDWEDGNLVDGAVASLTDAGTAVLSVTSAIPPQPRSSPSSGYDVAVLWTPAAQSNVAIQRALFHARDALYLIGPQSPTVPGGGRAVRVQTEAPRPRRPAAIGDPGDDVRRRLADAVARNGGIPFHLLNDKFCRDRATGGVVATAYAVAVARLDRTHPDRRSAVLAHAAVLRFQGRWPEALGILRFECGRGSEPELFDLALDLDLLSLTFESGEVASIPKQTTELLRRALDEEDWPAVIAAYRLLGMYGEETGDFRHARDHLSRAYHYAEGLMDSAPLRRRVPSRAARLALAVDCLRDMAALEWRAGDLGAARVHLAEARDLLEGIAAEPVGVYLGLVIDYQQARVGYADTHVYEAAKKLLNRSYQGLTTFGNPIRLATVLESVAKLEMDFLRHRDDDARLLIPTLRKVRRVYGNRGHAYLAARAEAALGDLQFALGNWEQADDIYEEAAAELHRLDKTPDYVTAQIMRSRCAVRRGETRIAIGLLEELIGQLDGPDQRKRRADIRSELARLRREPLDENRLATDVEMTGVGEFTIHSWISDLLGPGIADADAGTGTGVILGIGDDAAILRAGDGADFVVSTDSVPPDLLYDDTPAGAKYAARLAVVSALSDVIAMGGRPTAVLVNLHLPRSKPVIWSTEFFKAAKVEAARYGATIVGGDLKEQPREGLTVVAVGWVERGRALMRNGANPGDLLVVTLSGGSGQLGARWVHDLWIHLSEREQALLVDVVHDDARYRSLALPVEIMEAVTAAQLPTSAMDTTDGILACAQLMGQASNVGFEMFPQAIEPHLHPTIRRLADSLGIAPFLFALNAGHDWEVVFTVARQDEARLAELIRQNVIGGRPGLAVIGRVLPREPWADEGIRIPDPDVLLPYFTDEKFTPMPARHRAREWLDYARDSSRHFPRQTGTGHQ